MRLGNRATGIIVSLTFCAAQAANPTSADAEFIQMSGDLQSFLNGVNIPGAGSEAFVTPSAADRAEFADAIAALLARDFALATSLADNQGYDLIEFTHDDNSQPYYVMRERTGSGFRGLGTYAFNPAWRRPLNIQAPHVPSDTSTGPESVEMFVGLDALFLQITGTHRCANAASSPCDGTTGACDGDSQPYRISDAAHFAENFFQVASNRVAAAMPGTVALQMHAFSVGCGETLEQTPVAQISNTACAGCDDCSQSTNSLCTWIALEINSGLTGAGYSGHGAVSWNATASDPVAVQVPSTMCSRVCGSNNTQGRALNGAADPCEDAVTTAPAVERFIHIEQLSILTRAGPGGSPAPGVSREVIIGAIESVFAVPPQTWVNFHHTGSETGSLGSPWNTLDEAVQHTTPGGTIRIRAGTSSETPVIASRVTLRGFDGSAVIGVH